MAYSFAQLEDLWKQAGGNPLSAAMAAAVAMAESGGNPNSTNNNSDGSVDRGLWQINSVHQGLSTFDPMANARAAVQISSNGTTWRPWCVAWSSGLCSGTYLGGAAPFWKFLPGGSSTGGETPSIDNAGTIQPVLDFNPLNWPEDLVNKLRDKILRPIGLWFWYGAEGLIGFILILLGVAFLIRETRTAQVVKGAIIGVASKGRAGSSEGEN